MKHMVMIKDAYGTIQEVFLIDFSE